MNTTPLATPACECLTITSREPLTCALTTRQDSFADMNGARILCNINLNLDVGINFLRKAQEKRDAKQ